MLSHIKVLDLTASLGCYTARLLAELGADVMRIEPEGGVKPGLCDDIAWNTGKARLSLDPNSAAGRERLLRYVQTADILVRNSTTEPFDHALLADRNPRLIDVVVAPFDARGPRAARPATDLTLMARSGLVNIVGDPDRAPMTLPGAQAYALAGAQGVVAALTALHGRASTGRGELVTVSAFQSAVLANYREPVMWQFARRIGRRTGNLLVRGKSGVRQIWPCRDGYVTWSFVDNPSMMRSLVGLMREQGGAGELESVDWQATLVADSPQETLERWERAVEAFFARHSRTQLAQWSMERGFGLSQIDEVDDVLGSEQLQQRSMWRTVVGPDGRTLRVPGPLFASSPGEPS